MDLPTLEEMTTLDALRAAWMRVQRGGGAAGSDGLTVADFARTAHEDLPRLARALQEGTYSPQPLCYASLEKSDGERRELAYPTVRDRIAQTAVYQHLGPRLDDVFLKVSYGYRPGRSHYDAVQAVLDARSRGFEFVLDADIESFFDAVPHAPLLQRLREWGLERALVRLLRGWVKAPLCKNGRLVRRRRTGLPQGAVVSPLLANTYLDAFDRRMQETNWHLVRYADDFVVLCRSEQAAQRAMHASREVLADLELRLRPEKTRVASFTEGFCFLGHRFQEGEAVPRKRSGQRNHGTNGSPERDGSPERTVSGDDASAPTGAPNKRAVRAMPPAPATESPSSETESPSSASSSPPSSTSSPEPSAPSSQRTAATPRALYLQRQGATLRLRQDRFVLTPPGTDSSDDPVLDVPARKVNHVLAFGACRLTVAAKRHCLQSGIPVTYLAQSGAYYGQLAGAPPTDTDLLHRQLQRTREPKTRLQVARALIDARLGNSHALFRRHTGDDKVGAARRRLQRTRRRLPQAGTLKALRGHEGSGTAALFGALGRLIKAPGFAFERRTRRPPTDPMNALLSLGYTLLHHHMRAFLHTCGLHAHAGFLHEARPDHPALASDLVEPFRVLVERLALRLLNRRVLQPDDFQRCNGDGNETPKNACSLGPDARKRFFRAFEKMLGQEVQSSDQKRPVTYRRRLHRAARNVARFVQGEVEFEPFRLR
jgi:CRISPR-associated protein Cas1